MPYLHKCGNQQQDNIMAKKKFDPYQVITDSIIDALEAGTPPWRAQWKGLGGSGLRPISGGSGNPYNGINVLLCWLAAMENGYWSNVWHTYKGAKGKGGQVRKGQKASVRIVKWLWFPKKDASGNVVIGKDGEPKKIGYPKLTPAWNACQIEWEEGSEHAPGPAPTVEDHDGSQLGDNYAEAKRVLDAWHEVVPVTYGGNRAYYSPSDDRIQLPCFEQFEDEAAFISVDAHECGHSTGHEDRLDRKFGKRFGEEAYAFEELVAELTAAFLGADFGISQPTEPRPDHASYLASWLKVLKGDKKAIITAASQAEKAAKLILENAGVSSEAEEQDAAMAAK
jgi:antirestriction protein ArdC